MNKNNSWWPILKRISYEEGKLKFLGIPYTLVNARIIPQLHAELRKIVGPAVRAIIYQGSFDQSYNVVDKALKSSFFGFIFSRLGIRRIDLAKKVIQIIAGEGWGAAEITKEGDLTKGDFIMGRVYNSFEAKFYGKSKEPVCVFLMGALAGGASAIWREEIIVEETKCMARGDPFCEFKAVARRFYYV